jgi:hypothetical protein
MKTCGLFTTHRVELDVEHNKPFKLIPFGDVHRDSRLHCSEYWNRFLEYAKQQTNAVFLGMGDYSDGCSTSERIALRQVEDRLHEDTKADMEANYRGTADTLFEELKFMRGRCLGLLGGNHYFQFSDGDTTDHVLAAKLGAKFLGVCSFIRLSLRFKGRESSRRSIDILAHHGLGGGRLAGSTFNTVERMGAIADADIYLMGHDHNKGCIPGKTRLHLSSTGKKTAELNVVERVPWYGRTGSFLKAYEPGMPSYNVDAGRSPVSLGWIEFEITPFRDQRNKNDQITFQIRGTA